MTDLMGMLKNLHRPRLLIRAARFGVAGYNRKRDLHRLLKTTIPPTPGGAIIKLMGEERHQEDKRKSGDTTYSITRHVSILIALMGEARLLQVRSDKA